MVARRLYEDQGREDEDISDVPPIANGRLFTQPYDLVIDALMNQIEDDTVHLRQITERPEFQRWYVWDNRLASQLIESILLNIPIPPCYLSQDHEYRLDVIDGQQRIYSIYRFLNNQFPLRGLAVLTDLHGKRFHELHHSLQRKITTFTLRCVVITNDSDPAISFEVFERLNTNTVPLNAQELRNSISRGSLIDLLGRLAYHPPWLAILNRKTPDRRMRDEELILRFFGFYIRGPEGYSTPQKRWLNDVANDGKGYSRDHIDDLEQAWVTTIHNCLIVFKPWECFRRLPVNNKALINRALMDLTMHSLADVPADAVKESRDEFYSRYKAIIQNDEFDELITRGIDHRTRTRRRFEMWSENVTRGLL